jgi:hypothetical protein
MINKITLHIAAFVIFLCVSCTSHVSYNAQEAEFMESFDIEGTDGVPTRSQLEDEILRFEGYFSSLISNSFRPLGQSLSKSFRQQASGLELGYISNSLDVALGSIPEKNLLDMIVFVALIEDVYRDYWLPQVFKDEGIPVMKALEQSSKVLDGIASAYLTSAQLAEIKSIVNNWHQQNPNVITVERVRMTDFSTMAGRRFRCFLTD